MGSAAGMAAAASGILAGTNAAQGPFPVTRWQSVGDGRRGRASGSAGGGSARNFDLKTFFDGALGKLERDQDAIHEDL